MHDKIKSLLKGQPPPTPVTVGELWVWLWVCGCVHELFNSPPKPLEELQHRSRNPGSETQQKVSVYEAVSDLPSEAGR